jgi:hypothetical protein
VRLCLLALRHRNVKNAAEAIACIRASSSLAMDMKKLQAASELLRFEVGRGFLGASSKKRKGCASGS